MASRPADRMGISFWYNWLSDDFKDLVSPVDNLRDLYGFELYYNVAINKWLHLTPDLQLIKNEFNGDDLAIIPGVRAVIDF
jgi:carbohydrate-selective porin OprB